MCPGTWVPGACLLKGVLEVIGGVSEGAGVGAINRVSEAACEVRWLKWLLMPHRLWWLDTSELSES